MPLKDHLKSLKSEFNNIKQEFKQFQGQSQTQNQGQGYPGQGQQQSYGGYPQQQGAQYGGQYGGPNQQIQYGQQTYGVPQGQVQSYQPPQWQVQSQGQQQQWNQQPQQHYSQPHQQYQQPGPGYGGGQAPMTQHQQSPQNQQTYGPQPAQGQNTAQPLQQPGQPPPIPYGSHPGSHAAAQQQHSFSPPAAQQQPQHANPTTYWTASFHPQSPVSANFEHKLGNNNGWGNAELEHYTPSPSNSFHTPDSKLVIRAISQPNHPDPTQRYTSARLVSHQKLSHPSGCITAVITSPAAQGIWPAFWLLPSEPFVWPDDGEIDIMESWNAENMNHSCLHWGHFTPQDSLKHRVVQTSMMALSGRAVRYEFCWQGDGRSGEGGRMLWLIDGRAVMKASIPVGMRELRGWNVVLNVAMGGNVCGGKTPGEGSWEMVVHEMRMSGEPDGGWARVERDWGTAREGNTM